MALLIFSILASLVYSKKWRDTVQVPQPPTPITKAMPKTSQLIQRPTAGHSLVHNDTDVRKLSLLIADADRGNAGAQYNLAGLYLQGTAVLKDPLEAIRLYRMSADQGHVVAQMELGKMFERGLGVDKDSYEALKWYRRAASTGNREAQMAIKRLAN